jgi:LmbE family N-acetylglucosaminyl deacetylase
MIKDQLTLLAVLAHPDDESFGMGGTLALYARRGVAVHLICATRGEVGEVPPGMLEGNQSIGDLREQELGCAANQLGLTKVHFLGYRDSGMAGSPENNHPNALAAAPVDEVAARVTQLIRQIQPQVVLTFDPNGGYRHPDHIAIHQATVKAFFAAREPSLYPSEENAFNPQRLYYHTFPHHWIRLAVRLMPLFGKDPRQFGKNGDINLLALVNQDFPIHARINYRSVTNSKLAASACHASQGSMASSSPVMRVASRLAGTSDNFMRAFPPAHTGEKEQDLFVGINHSKQD